ncbi:MAG TPA: hypothetical protein VKB88_01995 [Bryobacteraceae bacterium]|nr:hypothetical protein [Bryobacteraceae bacterium]
MRKPVEVALTVVATVAMASCGRQRVDPCAAATFNEQACQNAVTGGGYYWNGSWYSTSYSHAYPYYYDQYHSFISRGGTVVSAPGTSYSRPSGGTVVRGGFGSSGEAHGGSAGGHGGAGE